MRYVITASLLLTLIFVGSVPVRATGLLYEDTKVPATYPQVAGSPTWSLEAVVVRADDNQRHPLAVFIDGTPESNPRPMLYVAQELARRGWTTVAVTRPGYGTSQGKEPPGDFVSQANFAAQTLRETIRVMGQMPYIDPSRAIAIGHSTGGAGAVALTANPPANLVAAISFAGNNGANHAIAPPAVETTGDAAASMVQAFATFGKTSRVPMLWIYAENDLHMGPALAQAYYKAFTDAGGKAVLHMAPATPAGSDGHQLYSMANEVPIWTPYLDQFLSDQHLALISPPLDVTLPDVAPPDGLSDAARRGFTAYLAAMPHKAFAASHSHWNTVTWRDSVDEAADDALRNCKSSDTDPCKVVLMDDKPALYQPLPAAVAESPFIGNRNAPVTIAYWYDYQCPFCRKDEETCLPQIVKDYVNTGKVKVEFKDFAFLGQDSRTLGQFSRAVWAVSPAKFYQWHKAIYDNQGKENHWATHDKIMSITTSVLAASDANKVDQLVSANGATYQRAMDAENAERHAADIGSTPTMIIGTHKLTGSQPYVAIKQLIDLALAGK